MLAPERKLFCALLEQCGRGFGIWTVFSDFLEMSAIAISNSVDATHFDDRNMRREAIVRRYDKEDVARLEEALETLARAMEKAGFDDVLGKVYHELALNDQRRGQFFTPYPVSLMMARMSVGESGDVAKHEGGFVRVGEPACGSGGMMIAVAQALHDAGNDYRECLHVTAKDIDPQCVRMAYIQLSLLGVPAVVIEGNGLTDEVASAWYTPQHVIGGWTARLAERAQKQKKEADASPGAKPVCISHLEEREAA